MESPNEPRLTDEDLKLLGAYLDGKMKRYSLLFSVNGGAFAIASLSKGGEAIVGTLELWHLALGAILFTVVMTVDIFLWGLSMSRRAGEISNMVFTRPGQIIVGLLSFLLILAWTFSSWGQIFVMLGAVFSIGVGVQYILKSKKRNGV